jgi:hypothetical protein
MTDSTTELDEAQAEADEEDEVDDSDDELDMDKLSLEDRKVIPGCTLLIKTCGSLAGQVRLCITRGCLLNTDFAVSRSPR